LPLLAENYSRQQSESVVVMDLPINVLKMLLEIGIYGVCLMLTLK